MESRSLLLLLLKLLLVECKLFALKDVAIRTARLTWARGDARQQPAARKDILENWVHLLLGLPCLQLEDHMATLLLGLLLTLVLGLWTLLLLAEINAVLLHVPLLEWLRIDLHDC